MAGFDKHKLAFNILRGRKRLLEQLTHNIDFHTEIVNRPGSEKVLPRGYENRHFFFEFLNEEVIKGERIDYLEFGVFQGESFKLWLKLNANPESRFFGFDTFTGLPEDWNNINAKGAFTVDGNSPQIDDSRGQFFAGLFQDSLYPFLESFKPEARMVVHLDADLYSSTLFCLAQLDRYLSPGAILIFDEFNDLLHEQPALHDYLRSHGRDFKMLCRTPDYSRIAIELI